MNPKNPCAGAYADTLDIKLVDECNGRCPFCIERGGKQSLAVDVQKMIEAVKTLNPPSVLILGGEPFLHKKLDVFLEGIQGREIFITTNGSKLGDLPFVRKIAKCLTGINISIHHYNLMMNEALTGVSLKFDDLVKAIAALKAAGVKVRINTNLVRGYLDNKNDVMHMVSFAKILGADEIRFAELQNAEDMFVDASNFFEVSGNPCRDGCETKTEINGMPVTVRVTCGYVNRVKPEPTEDKPKVDTAGVLYPDGMHADNWIDHNQYFRQIFQQREHDAAGLGDYELRRLASGDCHGSGGSGCH